MIRPRTPSPPGKSWLQQRRQFPPSRVFAWSLCAAFLLWITAWHTASIAKSSTPIPTPDLVQTYIQDGRGDGGRWFIPREWLGLDDRVLQPYPDLDHYMDIRNPRTPAEAAQLALELCMRKNLYLQHTKIPLIVHQTWKTLDASLWTNSAKGGVEEWLRMATGKTYPDLPNMAYIMWDDKAVDALIELYEKEMWPQFQQLPRPVEKADIFRVAVVKWFGGVYADIDTDPLRHPYQWVKSDDLTTWNDPKTDKNFRPYEPLMKSYQSPDGAPFRPDMYPSSPSDITPASYKNSMDLFAPTSTDVGAIFGIEGDNSPDTDEYWRAGYSLPVQVTNWALASAPHHPIAIKYMNEVREAIQANATRLSHVDPLELTGPPELTRIIKDWSEWENSQFAWDSVSGRQDPSGGRGKVVAGDIMILPITGFSPGRGKFKNMGSQPVDHPNARLCHLAQGSWRHTSVRVEAGKICRTVLGRCRDWSKVP